MEATLEVIEQPGGGKLAQLASQRGVSLRDFLLEQLNKHKNMTEVSKQLGVRPRRIRIDMSRARIVEVRKYQYREDSKTAPVVVTYLPEEDVLAYLLPVVATH